FSCNGPTTIHISTLSLHDALPIFELVEKVEQPMVLDADGLNIVSEKTSVLRRCKGKRLLTPHPGEMKRLFRDEQHSRGKTATKRSEEHTSELQSLAYLVCRLLLEK